jgi:hypothetical protein
MHTRLNIATRLLLAGLLLAGGAANAATYNELINGDLSDSGLTPTELVLANGSNLVNGQFGKSLTSDTQDRDYLRIVVPAGFKLNQLVLNALNAGGDASFLAVQIGPQVTMPPTSFDPSPLLGYAHFRANQQGTDLLFALGIENGLAAGTYTFWINETNTAFSNYSYAFDFQLTPLPPPPVPALPEWGMLLLGITLLGVLWRRRVRGGI